MYGVLECYTSLHMLLGYGFLVGTLFVERMLGREPRFTVSWAVEAFPVYPNPKAINPNPNHKAPGLLGQAPSPEAQVAQTRGLKCRLSMACGLACWCLEAVGCGLCNAAASMLSFKQVPRCSLIPGSPLETGATYCVGELFAGRRSPLHPQEQPWYRPLNLRQCLAVVFSMVRCSRSLKHPEQIGSLESLDPNSRNT